MIDNFVIILSERIMQEIQHEIVLVFFAELEF